MGDIGRITQCENGIVTLRVFSNKTEKYISKLKMWRIKN